MSKKNNFQLSDIDIRKIVSAKILYRHGITFLDNKDVQQIYNMSIVLFANSIEIVCFLLAKKNNNGLDKSDERISVILKQLKKLNPFPFNETKNIFDARNGIYHNARYITYQTCEEMKVISLICLRQICRNHLDIDFDSVSLTDLISDEKIREPLKIAEKHLNKENYNEAIRNTCIAFANFETRISKRGSWQVDKIFSKTWENDKISWKRLESLISMGGIHKDPNLDLFSTHIENQVNKKFEEFSKRINFVSLLGKHFEDYKQFINIKPLHKIVIDGSIKFNDSELNERDFSKDEAEFCLNFVMEVILDIQSKIIPFEIRGVTSKVFRIIE